MAKDMKVEVQKGPMEVPMTSKMMNREQQLREAHEECKMRRRCQTPDKKEPKR